MSKTREETTVSDFGLEFTSMADMLLAEIVIDHFERHLTHMREVVEEFKRTSQLFQGHNDNVCKQKKKLINSYLNCTDPNEKERFGQRLVSLTFFYAKYWII